MSCHLDFGLGSRRVYHSSCNRGIVACAIAPRQYYMVMDHRAYRSGYQAQQVYFWTSDGHVRR